jgi:hypothetical protein
MESADGMSIAVKVKTRFERRPPESNLRSRPLPAAEFHKCKPSEGLQILLFTQFTQSKRKTKDLPAFSRLSLPQPARPLLR